MEKNEFNPGFLLHVGNMSGGKTAHMILNLQRANFAGKNVQAFKVSWDNRYEEGYITANNKQMKFPASSVPDFSGLEKKLDKNVEVLGIDEMQFWDDRIIGFIREYRDKMKIIGTALQRDFRGNPFRLRSQNGRGYDSDKHIGELLALADDIETHWPVCTYSGNGKICGEKAQYVQRWNTEGNLSNYDEKTLNVENVVNSKEEKQKKLNKGNCAYEVRCARHYIAPER